jgi:hypothetical protein
VFPAGVAPATRKPRIDVSAAVGQDRALLTVAISFLSMVAGAARGTGGQSGRIAWPNKTSRLFILPDLQLRDYQAATLTDIPPFMGRTALTGRYWFQRPG